MMGAGHNDQPNESSDREGLSRPQSGSKTAIIIAGPTAIGKTAMAIQLAKKLNTEIISFDSRQCYKEMKIGVARPTDEELYSVPHHFIASHSIEDKIDASYFEDYALKLSSELFQKHDTLVFVGGTGLYIKAFLEGLDAIPHIEESLRHQINSEYKEKGLTWLQEKVAAEDPFFYEGGEILNPHRLIRALEVKRATGKSIRDYQGGIKKERPFATLKLFLNIPRAELVERINARTNKMIEDGLVEEVRELYSMRGLPALQTVGYREIFDCLDGKANLEETVEKIKTNTRQYAKRQVTWFKKAEGFIELNPNGAEAWQRIVANL